MTNVAIVSTVRERQLRGGDFVTSRVRFGPISARCARCCAIQRLCIYAFKGLSADKSNVCGTTRGS